MPPDGSWLGRALGGSRGSGAPGRLPSPLKSDVKLLTPNHQSLLQNRPSAPTILAQDRHTPDSPSYILKGTNHLSSYPKRSHSDLQHDSGSLKRRKFDSQRPILDNDGPINFKDHQNEDASYIAKLIGDISVDQINRSVASMPIVTQPESSPRLFSKYSFPDLPRPPSPPVSPGFNLPHHSSLNQSMVNQPVGLKLKTVLYGSTPVNFADHPALPVDKKLFKRRRRCLYVSHTISEDLSNKKALEKRRFCAIRDRRTMRDVVSVAQNENVMSESITERKINSRVSAVDEDKVSFSRSPSPLSDCLIQPENVVYITDEKYTCSECGSEDMFEYTSDEDETYKSCKHLKCGQCKSD
ncbi:hypothetical protein HD806DRAFT_533676 [Xylariaceae sp. AK1471]|nr:hypothetical protein HD806DRAFT_533676 [Xylariaceae sp. AK1471]